MNKVTLMGRLTKDPEIRYSQSAEPVAVARYTLAVARRFKRQGEQEADFIGCVAFGKNGEFVQKYFKKGQMIAVSGRLQVRTWEDRDGQKHWVTEVVAEEHYFAESKAKPQGAEKPKEAEKPIQQQFEGFYPIDESDEDELPF